MRARLRRGTSLLEVTVSTAILAFLVFAAASASQVAISTADDVTVRDAVTGGERRTTNRFEGLLLSASLSSLLGVPSNQGVVAEPMQQNVDYKELQFRRAAGYVKGAIVYEPPLGTAAARLYRAVETNGDGSLVLEDRGRTTTLISEVQQLTFRRVGSRLTISVSSGRGHDLSDRTTSLVLRVP